MLREKEEKVQSIGSGLIGDWTRKTRQDANHPIKARYLVVFVDHAFRAFVDSICKAYVIGVCTYTYTRVHVACRQRLTRH
jgi:hypothetical protein